MRVSFNMIYNQSVSGMNSRLAEMMRLNEQSASQKKLNRPSDDPAGMARSLDLRSAQSAMDQYLENIDTAEAWLTQADDELRLASNAVTRLKEIAEQAATGTYSNDQREMIAAEARELMAELVSIANSEFVGDSIFAGSKIDTNAYALGLGATVRDAEGESLEVLAVTGNSNSTTYIEFLDSGQVGADTLRYRYTTDNGDTWQNAELAAGDTTIVCGGVRTEIAAGSTVAATSEEGAGDGSVLWLRPAAYYQGNVEGDAEVVHHGVSPIAAEAQGVFSSNVLVRVDSGGTLPGPIEYSYSTNGGSTWSSGHTTSDATFGIPGGYVELASNGGDTLAAGDQFLVQPQKAAILVDISPSSTVQINSIGKDIFGGLYTPVGESQAVAAVPSEENLLETVGELVGYLETNNQDGAAECLDKLSGAHARLTVALGDIGGRETRLEFARNSVETIKATTAANISDIEDVDITQLTIDLAKAEYAYQAVLRSSSQIMNLSLLDYI
ncbi:flagellar hook-associated protein 3 [Oceanidesulfovibrio indonesiensis]|uniref:Flagellar hook-associated protein 3 n=1 Tax=Oceanidesulfovibrio indonesiensis TaxID=54767 RepID=A0A7M3MD58_9BACT|nr:flagellar hook-associated protein FlgL [Oceanidesulfovibrio indonesiensis]TVM15939.1 flagellar hook-associated protein 3 [Oceanidesulfovibrio indonesiensis]